MFFIALLTTIGHSKSHDAGWSSLVARQAHNLKAAGSNPAPATNELSFCHSELRLGISSYNSSGNAVCSARLVAQSSRPFTKPIQRSSVVERSAVTRISERFRGLTISLVNVTPNAFLD